MEIAESWTKIERALGARWAPWPTGASPEAIATCETALGVALPDSYRASVAIHDGSGSFIGAHELITLVEVAETAHMFEAVVASLPAPSTHEIRIAGPVRARRWDRSLVPFARTTSADTLLLDLDPAGDGHAGQVIHMTREMNALRLIAPGFAEWLEMLASDLAGA